jgi:hypothetical protein
MIKVMGDLELQSYLLKIYMQVALDDFTSKGEARLIENEAAIKHAEEITKGMEEKLTQFSDRMTQELRETVEAARESKVYAESTRRSVRSRVIAAPSVIKKESNHGFLGLGR